MPSSKRKRAGPGLSFAERDRQGQSSGPSNGGGGRRQGYNQVYRLPSKLISGPGIFVTCVQGKERKAALQFIDHLNEIADRLYPGVKLLPPLKHEVAKEAVDGEEEDLMDAMRNGPATATAANEEAAKEESTEDAAPTAVREEEPATATAGPAKEAPVVDDIEAQIQAELAELRGDTSAGGPSKKAKTEHKDKDDGTPTQRFKKIETDTECLNFISCARPIDPYTMVYAVLEEVERTGEPRSRFVQRLSPVTDTCSAHPTQVTQLANRVIPTFFPPDGPARSFKIDPRIRSHNTLTRDSLIQIIAASIPREGGHYADLKKPDVWIIVEVHKNVCAIGVVRDYERFKKLNVQSVADAANAKKAEAYEEHKDAAAQKQEQKQGDDAKQPELQQEQEGPAVAAAAVTDATADGVQTTTTAS
ncbi:uncharacterized protein PFL1_01321 [Pseudozyma flocculosa PF-1]|uniref:Related to TAN1 - putative tRNA acetyltransferase n=1 Tax=Pseudozyma flocculosa TaxID=84751 RepID=A0A5C3EWM4_9BASI|nr:uncharacterized protein PFL1_01321 [Pseudozyma flocculosa PF-1]EPQ31132.1 hypothetical protein PFL1_01321 [Pseudozyma flocculosa PF-1]SPO35996.1 related to TAN1 - putative tRNA acetyltransferase [Pseudozyma flocculosa]